MTAPTFHRNEVPNAILKFLQHHAGIQFSVHELSNELQYPVKTITNAAGLLTRNGANVQRVTRGTYIWIPTRKESESGDELYEKIGTTKRGTIIVRGSNNSQLYQLKEFDV